MCDLAKDSNGIYNQSQVNTIETVIEKLIDH